MIPNPQPERRWPRTIVRCVPRSIPALVPLALACLLAACAERPLAPAQPALPAQPSPLTLEPASFGSLAGWTADGQGGALAALRRSCPRLVRAGPGPQDLGLSSPAWNWTAICSAAGQVPIQDHGRARVFFERWFEPRRMSDRGRADGLLTGYYEPEFAGARTPGPQFSVPLYKRPDDLVSVDLGQFDGALKGRAIAGRVVGGALSPYPTRGDIDKGALKGRGLELAWLADPVDVFVLHVQGSGRVMLADGTVLRAGFAGHNGHDYVAIGRELVNEGAIPADQVTMPSIRGWLQRNPAQAAAMMARNPRYVFFRSVPPAPDDGLGPAGPLGAAGVPLTAERSLAVDRAFVPLGLPVWIEADDPRPGRAPLRRLTVAQDTGGAIKGAVRGDLFWGGGRAAEEAAGLMKSRAAMWLLVPKS